MMGRKSLENRDQVMMLNLETLVPENHLVRKMDRLLDLNFVYELLEETYCDDNGRPSVDPVVIMKLALIKKMFGIRSVRKTLEEANVNLAYRWYLGYGLDEELPHFSSFLKSYAKRFGDNDLFGELFGKVLGKCAEKKVVKPEVLFIDSTHMKASANKGKAVVKQIEAQGKLYQDELEEEINKERAELGKAPLKKKDEMTSKEIKVSTTDPEAGLFHKSDKEKCFAYSLHTVCDEHGFVLGTEVTPGNIHDSVMLKFLVEKVIKEHGKPTHVAADAGYKTPFNCRYLLKSGILPAMPYTRPKGSSELIPTKEFIYDEYYDCYICPENQLLKLGTIDREGYRLYRSEKKICRMCPRLKECTRGKQAQRVITRHVWRDYLDEADHLRHTTDIKMIYKARKETIERVFADGKEKHGMRYTHYRGLRKVTDETLLSFACMNLKKLIAILTRKGEFPEGTSPLSRFLNAILDMKMRKPYFPVCFAL